MPGDVALDQALLHLADRIEALWEEERRLLQHAAAEDFDRLIERKEHLAVEVARLMQHALGFDPQPSTRLRLRAMRERLTDNKELLQRHIDAVGEIAALIAGVLNSAMSDGTYSRHAVSQRYAP